jgi:hypothetical protein
MTVLALKTYQTSLLASVEAYFRSCRLFGDAKGAFHRTMLEGKTRERRREAVSAAYQQSLFTDGVRERGRAGGGFDFEFHPDGYAPSRNDPARNRRCTR